MTKAERLDQAIRDLISSHEQGTYQLALGYLRYEAVRKLNMVGFWSLCQRRTEGEDFDAMVDDLVISDLTPPGKEVG